MDLFIEIVNKFKELQEYLQFLKSVTLCTHKTFYINSWQKVIEHLFSNCINENRKNVTNVCMENMRIVQVNVFFCVVWIIFWIMWLQTCPVLFSLDFVSIIDNLLKINLPEFAAVLLQYLPEDKRLFYVKVISLMFAFIRNCLWCFFCRKYLK